VSFSMHELWAISRYIPRKYQKSVMKAWLMWKFCAIACINSGKDNIHRRMRHVNWDCKYLFWGQSCHGWGEEYEQMGNRWWTYIDQHICGFFGYSWPQNVQNCRKMGAQDAYTGLERHVSACEIVLTHDSAFALISANFSIDEAWISLFSVEIKCKSTQWKYTDSLSLKKFHVVASTEKVITIFLDADGTILTYCIPKDTSSKVNIF